MRAFEKVADGVRRLAVMPFDTVNVYLLGDVLVDAGIRSSSGKILRALEGHTVAAHAITHAHPDHQGSSHALCEALSVPFWCGAGDREAAASGRLASQYPGSGSLTHGITRVWAGPGHTVDRALREGDEVGGFTVLETPGHTPGHVAFWRPGDGVLVLGDVCLSMDPFVLIRRFREPPGMFTVDPERNRASARRLAALGATTVCFGHGPPRSGEELARFVATLD